MAIISSLSLGVVTKRYKYLNKNKNKNKNNNIRRHYFSRFGIILYTNISSLLLAGLWYLLSSIALQEDFFYHPAYAMYHVLYSRIKDQSLTPTTTKLLGEFTGIRLAIVEKHKEETIVANMQYVQNNGDTKIYYMSGYGGYLSIWPLHNTPYSLIVADQYEQDSSMFHMLANWWISDNNDIQYYPKMATWQWHFPIDLIDYDRIELISFEPEYQYDIRSFSFWVIVVNLFIVAAFIVMKMRRMEKDMAQLRIVSKAWAKGKFEKRLNGFSHSSLYGVKESFNEMAECISVLLKEQFVLVHAISHELSTPLHKMRLALTIMDAKAAQEGQVSTNTDIERYVDEMEQLAGSILGFAKLSTIDNLKCEDEVELDILIGQRCEYIGALYPDIMIELSLASVEPLMSCEFHLQLAIDNVLKNAYKYAQSQVHVQLLKTNTGYELTIEDDGKGLGEQELEQTKATFVQGHNAISGGFGLGLAIVGTVMSKLHGKMAMSSSKLGGLKMVLSLNRY
jgi:two-component system OmpR family sensor kinase